MQYIYLTFLSRGIMHAFSNYRRQNEHYTAYYIVSNVLLLKDKQDDIIY